MKDKRQGNDLKVAWSIFMQDGEPFRLDGKDVSLYLKNMFGRKELNDFVVTGNIIQWTFYGKDQKNTGKYSLEMVINEGEKGMITTDKCNFVNLVPCTCKLQGGEDDLNVETESIELTSTLEYVAGGGSGDSIIVEGDAPSSALIKGTYAEATNEAATAFGGVESFLYHEGEDDERTIEVPNPTTASGLSAHAEGIGTIASGVGAHAEGNVAITHDYLNEDTGEYEQTVIVTEAGGRGAHAEGLGTKSMGSGSHSEGIGVEVLGNSGHGEGYYTKIHGGEGTHVEGMQTDANGNGAHAEGYHTLAEGTAAHAEGRGGVAGEKGAHVEGGYLKESDVLLTLVNQGDRSYKITSPKNPSIIEGLSCNSRDGGLVIIDSYDATNKTIELSREVEDGIYLFSNTAIGISSHSEGGITVAKGDASHSEGYRNIASGRASHAEGVLTKASGAYAHAENEETVASGDSSHAEGYLTQATANQAHAEGNNTKATARDAHAEGKKTEANGEQSHVEGYGCIVNGECAHAEGDTTKADSYASHTEGVGTVATNNAEHAQGKYNKSNSGTIHSVGIGSSNSRKNAFEIMSDGRVFVKEVGGYVGTDVSGKKDLASVIKSLEENTGSVSSATPDWDASEGEEGFIKNRTHYKIDNTTSYEVDNIEESDGEYFYQWSLEFNPDEEISSLYLAYDGKETEVIDLSDVTEDGIELSVSFGSYKDGYDPLECIINIDQTSNNKLVNISAQSWGNYEGITANIKRYELHPLAEEYIPKSIARKSDLTELSLQVGTLSERVDDLEQGGQGGEQEVFKAIKGETTYAEVAEAYAQGKVIHCDYKDRCYVLASFTGGLAWFTSVLTTTSYLLTLNADGWGEATYNLENGGNRVNAITESAKDYQYPSAKAVYDFVQQSGTSTDKQGVVSQTLNYNTADNTYSVSNVVRGAIPSFFIDLVTEAGATFNTESGYFSLNGIDNIAYDEMRQIYDCRTGYGTNSLLAVYGNTYTARTNFAAFRGASFSASNHEPTTIYTKYLGYQNASITKFAFSDNYTLIDVKAGSANNFDSFGSASAPLQKSRLEEIIGIIGVTNLTGSNNFFYNGAYHAWLTTFKLKALKASIDLSGMPRLNEATILYMINNEKATSAITIKLHADAKAMADASEAIQSALAAHTNITLGV